MSLTAILDDSKLSPVQWVAIIICISLNALDGFDVLAISFASPGIAAEWGINRAELGVVLAMELVGMAFGSIFLGGIADKFGRKPTIQFCLVLMTAGMFGAAFVDSVMTLLIIRFITGLGIGGMLASTNAMVSEFANKKSCNLCVIIMATGYPIGAVLGGSIASMLLETHTWRAVFIFGGSITGLFMLVVAFWLPESLLYMVNHPKENTLDKVNHMLARMKKPLLDALPAPEVSAKKSSYSTLFSSEMRKLTLLLMVAYFAQIMTFYFILKWIPKIVVDMGFGAAQAGQVLVWANLGGAVGAILLGLLTSKLNLRLTMIPVLILAFVMVSVFGIGYSDLSTLALVSAATGFFTNAGVVGLYGLMAQAFPANVRASGTGVVIGIGRGGAALSPVVAGLLFTNGVSLQGVAIAMGTGALVATLAIYFLNNKQGGRGTATHSSLSAVTK